MRRGHPHICLFEPEIPQNTGSIGRLAAATACRLHLIRPFGFTTDDRNLLRPGLDYWPFLDLEIHDSLAEVVAQFPGRVAFFSKVASRPYTEVPAETELFIFGRETSGFPPEVHAQYADHFYNIPMFHPGVRSLNLANAAAIVVYDRLLRQNGGASPLDLGQSQGTEAKAELYPPR